MGIRGVLSFVRRHRARLLRALPFLLLGVVIVQNLEATTIDVFFWSLAEVPKLVLIVVSMVVGIVLWELLKTVGGNRSRRRRNGV